MAKTATTIFTCAQCDAQHPKWLGQCSTCGAWGTLTQSAAPAHAPALPRVRPEDIPTLDAIATTATARMVTGIGEFDLALGGGIVPGSVLLLAGEPGIGKSTLILQIAAACTTYGEVVYVTGEETAPQLRSRAERLGLQGTRIRVLATTDGAQAASAIRSVRPTLAIVDSIQTLTVPDLPVDAGAVTQVRALTSALVAAARASNVPVIAIGHVTKDGDVAGPKALEHLVDQVAILEGEPTTALRVLRTTKNRYGPTDVVGVFAMTERGMEPVTDPAAAFLGSRSTLAPGSAVTVTIAGNRALLVDIQALITRSSFGQPQRRAVGVDVNRLHVLLAVLAKHGRLALGTSDVHLATAGGFRVADPASDLAIAAALVTAASDRMLPCDACIGEIGLDGTIRPVRALERRVAEAVRLGRTRVAVPPGTPDVRGARLLPIATIPDLVAALA